MMLSNLTPVLHSLVAAFETIALAYFFGTFMKRSFSNKPVYFCVYAAYFCINLTLSLSISDVWVRGIFGVLFPFAASLIFYSGKVIRKIFLAELVLVFHLAAEPLATVLLSWASGHIFPEVPAGDVVYFIAAGLSTLIYLLAVGIVAFRQKPEKSAVAPRMYVLLCLMIGLCLLVSYGDLWIMLRSGMQTTLFNVMLSLCAYSMPVFVFYVFRRFQEHAYAETHSEILRMQLAQNEKQFELMEAHQLEIRKLKHDFSGQLITIQELAKCSSSMELNGYISGFSESTSRTLVKTVTGLLSTDAVIDAKRNQAERLRIALDIRAHAIAEIGVSPIELNNILLNTLDNAIEACALLAEDAERHIELGLKVEGGYLFVRVMNTALPVSIKDGLFPPTTKADKSAHGVGLESIAASVEKCGGIMTIEYKDGRFVFLARLCNERHA